jgi:metal-responsive CopG/Arc/MetJ family transcriptional regulator
MAMKIAISIQNPIFEAAERLAKELGMSRSELYTTAISAYIEAHRSNIVMASLNEIYTKEASTLDPVLLRMQVVTLDGENW